MVMEKNIIKKKRKKEMQRTLAKTNLKQNKVGGLVLPESRLLLSFNSEDSMTSA